MFENAISKIESEMNQNSNNSYIKVIGEFLLQFINENSEVAEKIMVEDKTIAKSLDAMKKVAEKKKTGNFAMLTPEEGFKAVLDYFDIKAETVTYASELPKLVPIINNTSEKKKASFDVKLEDLL